MSGAHPDTPRRTGQGHCHCQICIIVGFRVFLGYRLSGFSIQGLGWHVSGLLGSEACKKGWHVSRSFAGHQAVPREGIAAEGRLGGDGRAGQVL